MTREAFIRKWLGNKDKPYTEQFRDEMRDDLDKVIEYAQQLNFNFIEIERLVQLLHSEDWEYGNNPKQCAELIEGTRNKIGYTKNDVKRFLK